MNTQTRNKLVASTATRLGVSAIVCCYTEDRYEQILAAIASLKAQTVPLDEVIVVIDANRALYERLCGETLGDDVRIVLSDVGRGLSCARNVGIRAATGEFVAYLDDDAVARKDWLEKLLPVFDDEDAWVAGGAAELVWQTGRPGWFAVELDWVVGGSFTWLQQERAVVANPHGHNMIFRRAVFELVGGFDEGLGRVGAGGQGGEERDICLRLREVVPGALVVYEPAAVVRHHVPAHRATLSYLIKRSFNEGLSKASIHSARTGALSTEGGYLRYLALRSVPSRLRRFRERAALAQVGAIVLCVASTGTGYVVGRARGLVQR